MSDRLNRFVALSAEVTAFSTFQLQGTGQAQAYLAAIEEVVGASVVTQLLSAYDSIQSVESPEERAKRLRVEIFGDEKLGPIARNVIKLWYLGVWFELPTSWNERYGPVPKSVTFVVSPASYIEGLLWPAIGAHPPGAKAQGFGSWAEPPSIPQF